MSDNLFNLKFRSSDSNHFFVATTWMPTSQIKGVVQIAHGMREHMGRYNDYANFLNSQGFVVCGHDHIGHGKSAMIYGSYGFFGEDKGAATLVSDSILVTRYLAKKYPEVPLFLLGHSMGSYIARIQAAHISAYLSGLILIGSGEDAFLSPFARVATEAVSKIGGPRKNNYFVDKAFAAFCSRGLFKGELPDAWISRDSKTVESFIEDPFTKFTFTNQGYCDLLDLQMGCNSSRWYSRINKNLPILLLSGTKDPIGGFGLDIPNISRKLKKAGVADVWYRLFPMARHELLNEINKKEVYRYILNWIKARTIKQNRS